MEDNEDQLKRKMSQREIPLMKMKLMEDTLHRRHPQLFLILFANHDRKESNSEQFIFRQNNSAKCCEGSNEKYVYLMDYGRLPFLKFQLFQLLT
jgi:hypothetical protein